MTPGRSQELETAAAFALPSRLANNTDPKRTVHRMPVALRTLQALKLWHDVNLTLVRDGEPDLSSRQIAILLTIYLEAPPHTIRGLAAKLGVTKPVITRALDTMGKLELVARRRDETDRRNVIVQRTVKGALAVERLGDLVIATARNLPS
jgi:DNA-binding MarR family transcriptional regulator